MAINWLERARQKKSQFPNQGTAFTANVPTKAVNTVDGLGGFQKKKTVRAYKRSKRSRSHKAFSEFGGAHKKSKKRSFPPLSLLRIEDDAWVEFEERCAFLEFYEGLTREQAEERAAKELEYKLNGDET